MIIIPSFHLKNENNDYELAINTFNVGMVANINGKGLTSFSR